MARSTREDCMGEKAGAVWDMSRATFKAWLRDEAPRRGAAFAYHTIFSLAPMLVITVAVVSIFNRENSALQIERHIAGRVGPDAARLMSRAIHDSNGLRAGTLALVIGIALEVMGATAMFVELRIAMNRIFQVNLQDSPVAIRFLKDRVAAFAMMLVIVVLLLAAMLVSAALSAATPHFSSLPPMSGHAWRVLDTIVSVGVITVLFALLFRYVPDVRLPWRVLWIGAALTAILFVLGAYLIGLYLTHATVGSIFGAAGTLMALLAWVYYSAQIVFFGAEFTQVYSKRYGSRTPSDHTRAA